MHTDTSEPTTGPTTAPATGFVQFDLDARLGRGVGAAGFEAPRPIQQQAVPAILAGRDVLGLAQTGTGKTAAFAIPLIERLLTRPGAGVRVLVVAPTRELAAQISAEFQSLARFTDIGVATVFGGVPVGGQRRALARKPEIVVACPGRLLDLVGQGILRLDRVEVLVLDEADHMFDMGFLPDIRRIIDLLPAERQNLLFSATMPAEIRHLADRVLRHPEVVDVAHDERLETIEHALYPVENTRKRALLERLLGEESFRSAIVFTRTKHRARRLARQLEQSGHRAVALQGNMSQGQRKRAMDGFRARRFDVLVATDIAARGIDVEQVSHVVNFDMPNTVDAYTHRIGRTGRSERSGQAFTFVTAEDHALVSQVERRLEMSIPRRQVEGISSIPFPSSGSNDSSGSGRSGRSGGSARGTQGRGASGNGSGRNGGGRNHGARTKGARNRGTRTGGTRTGGRSGGRSGRSRHRGRS